MTGSIERVDIDGQERRTIVPEGGTFHRSRSTSRSTAVKLLLVGSRGMRVMRSNLMAYDRNPRRRSGGDSRPGADATKCASDHRGRERGHVNDAEKRFDDRDGAHLRANLGSRKASNAANRTDIEVGSRSRRAIDLELDLENVCSTGPTAVTAAPGTR